MTLPDAIRAMLAHAAATPDDGPDLWARPVGARYSGAVIRVDQRGKYADRNGLYSIGNNGSRVALSIADILAEWETVTPDEVWGGA